MNLLTGGRFLPYNPALKDRARYLRSNPTKAEKKLWYEFLRKLTFMVYRQRPINNFIVDFYLPMHKLVIEVDGDTHYEDNAIEYDQQRTNILQGYELKVIRFTNQEVLNNFEEVCKVITTHIQPDI